MMTNGLAVLADFSAIPLLWQAGQVRRGQRERECPGPPFLSFREELRAIDSAAMCISAHLIWPDPAGSVHDGLSLRTGGGTESV